MTEWEEWGDPREEPSASYMLSYSPYDNLGPHNYPAIYVTAGLNDPRVSYHEPAKWVAKLREIQERLSRLRSPIRSAERFFIEEIIDPRQTRSVLCEFAALAAPLRVAGTPSFGTRP